MEYRHLGRLGLKVSPLCLGTMNFGPQTSEPDSYAIMDRALELGINFFDTANVYGQRKGVGATEKIVGHWFAQGGGRRDKIVLATKVYGEMGRGPTSRGCRRCTSARRARTACGGCRPTTSTSTRCTTSTERRRGTRSGRRWRRSCSRARSLYVGSSNFAGWHIAKANEAAKDRHFLGLVSEQSIYNLAERTVELEVLPACEDYGLGVIPWSPLWRGMLGGVLDADGRSGRGARRPGAGRARGAPSAARGVREVLRRARRSRRRTSRSPGCSRTRSSRRRSSARGPSSSSRARCGRWT